ncbi:MAG: copper chaperone PCu(A)C [Sulfuritalea sp.]|nr:copper chaperone PCu(A)C [Sulfuritalea sp.]
MNRIIRAVALSTVVSAAFILPAQAEVTIKEPWVRATVAQQKATGAFMQITSSQDARLVEARSPVAGVVEIHEMSMDKDVMRMRAMPGGLELPGGKTVELKSGGYHIMLMQLKQQMKEGANVPLTLIVEDKDKKRSTIEIKAPVKPLVAASGMGAMKKHGH